MTFRGKSWYYLMVSQIRWIIGAVGTIRHLVDVMGHTLAGKVLLHRLEAAAAECDMIDNPRVGALLLVGLGDVIEVQYGMAHAIQPDTGKIERRARTIHESQN
jgi:hypothetical protein